ncbi:MAG: hypothetical protein U0P45_08480 [Acidimicrobiales bacterium]
MAGSSGASRRRIGVLFGMATGGLAVLLFQLLVSYSAAMDRSDDGLAWAWLVTFIGLPLVAYLGARLAPGRPWVTAGAALAADLALVFTMKAMVLLRLGWVGAQILAWHLALVAVTYVAARAGDRSARPAGPAAAAPPAPTAIGT